MAYQQSILFLLIISSFTSRSYLIAIPIQITGKIYRKNEKLISQMILLQQTDDNRIILASSKIFFVIISVVLDQTIS
ncbi:CSC1-like protein [Dirofilaria immitis]